MDIFKLSIKLIKLISSRSPHVIAVYIDSYVITLGLRAKYDIHGHYFRFAVRILANPQKKFQKQIVTVFIPITINISSVFISELVGCIQLTR